MQVVLLRVGIDSACGGMQGPLFSNGGFEYVPIPDEALIDKRTYGNTKGRRGRLLVDYFPPRRREKMKNQPIHFDPEFKTFTYGDPGVLKGRLRFLKAGDLLVFYAGLKLNAPGAKAALYIIGYFIVSNARRAREFPKSELHRDFGRNFHVMHDRVLRTQMRDLVLVKGGLGSRLLDRAFQISSVGKDSAGRPIKILSPKMRCVFGDFGGRLAIQRCPPRWISDVYVHRSAWFVKRLK